MGKVHGSLARAGKVKNQTPKVSKAEKKKPLTGRAKKRWVFNRRYVRCARQVSRRECSFPFSGLICIAAGSKAGLHMASI